MSKSKFFTVLLTIAMFIPAFAQYNDGGRNTAQDLYAPVIAGQGGFITSQGGSHASALNPAAEGDAQRIIFDAGYLALPDIGSQLSFSGIGAVNLGAVFPTRYGVFGGSIWFFQSLHDEFSLGTNFRGNLNAAKEIYPNMNLGIGLNLGGSSIYGFTISADLGFRYNIGELGPLENFTWAVTASGLGTSFIPLALTPSGGVSFDLFRVRGQSGRRDPLRVSFATDLIFPSFQNMAGRLGLNITIAETISISTSTRFNLRESWDNNGPSIVPSVGIGINWQLQSGGRRLVADRLPSDGDLSLNLAARPLYGDIWAVGGGITWSVGVMDSRPPVIRIDYNQPQWISPNNDGRADYLEFPISITDDRYVVEWTFQIFNEQGVLVREIQNKEPIPEIHDVRNLIDRIVYVQTGIDVPPALRWDGVFESGELAPDGLYTFTITASDDNSNTATIGPFTAYVRNTPPEINIENIAGAENIFSPGGGQGIDTFIITQSGSSEDFWEGGIYDASGNMVRTFNFYNTEPVTINWDGADDAEEIVPDGIYTYRITSTDRALNTSSASIDNIIVNTIRPEVALSINNAYFSPNGDGVQDTQIFSASVPVQDGIVEWNLEVRDSLDTVRRNFTGTGAVPPRVEFDGTDSSGSLLPEGNYSGFLSVRYRNGFVSNAYTPEFTLDITPPSATVRANSAIFSPFNPDSPMTSLTIYQESFKDVTWTGEIRPRGVTTGSPVRTFRFTPGNFPANIIWDGLSESGSLVPDGFYSYVLFATDPAGNTGRSNLIEFEVDTRDTPIVVSTDFRAFAPTGNSTRTSINILPQLQETAGIASWRININDANTGSTVRSFDGGENIPSSVNWNGRNAAGTAVPDGYYLATLEILYRNGNNPSTQSMLFTIDTVPPEASVSAPFTIFAPNGNGNRENIPIQVSTEGNDEWNAQIVNSQGEAVRSWNWSGRLQSDSLVWDGRDQAGNIVPDGSYNFTLNSIDEAGNSAQRNISNIMVDARVPRIFLTASSQSVAPRQGQAQAVAFNVINSLQEGIDSWILELRDENNRVIRSLPSSLGGTGAIPANINWNGANEQGQIQEGRFTPVLTVNYAKGDIVTATTPAVVVDTSGPVLSFRSTPEYFSPDNDGVDDELFIFLTAIDASPIAEWSLEIYETEGTRQLFYRIDGRGTPSSQIIWDGRSNRGELVQSATDYRYVFRAVDTLGNSSSIDGTITTDVLIIRDGDLLRIQVPSITFRANNADFIGIPQDRLDTNTWVLQRIAQILNRFRDYRITVEGHANPVLGTAAEETNELQPLSLNRARFIIDQLVSYGVARNRLSAIGRGGTATVAEPRDPDNNWKNRRVEFILVR